MGEIRPFVPADQPAIMTVWYEASIRAHDFVPPSFWAGERGLIERECIPRAEIWVHETDGAVDGFYALLDTLLGALFVSPEAQGRGIGSRLLAHATGRRETLTLEVFVNNKKARRFYERRGFVAKGRSVEPRSGCEQLEMVRGTIS